MRFVWPHRLGEFLCAEDAEYSVVPMTRLRVRHARHPVHTWYPATLLAWLYFDGALADPPASAGLHMSDPTDMIASVAVIATTLLCIASSSWFKAIDRNGY
jgi:hypothetical protein